MFSLCDGAVWGGVDPLVINYNYAHFTHIGRIPHVMILQFVTLYIIQRLDQSVGPLAVCPMAGRFKLRKYSRQLARSTS